MPRAILVGVNSEAQPSIWSLEDSMAELQQLVRTAGYQTVGTVTQRLRSPHPAHFVGRGKVDEIAEMRLANDADVVIFDDELGPGQQRNLEDLIKGPVIDRSQVILEIFAQRAQSREGRLQVALAQYEYLLPRLAGLWTHLSRQFGRAGARGGPGETQLEIDRRQARQRISDLKDDIEKVRRQRQLHRSNRQANGLQTVALVGYTNAGKSTLLNALTSATVTAVDRPFETLDPTTRRLRLPSRQEVLLTDTVGFIQKLPPSLVVAFRATLEELESADLLVHVVDVAHRRGFEQGQTVRETIESLGLGQKSVVTALNKIDQLEGAWDGNGPANSSTGAMLAELETLYPHAVAISAEKRWGLDRLLQSVEDAIDAGKLSTVVSGRSLPQRVVG